MVKKIYNACISRGTYKARDGSTKNKYLSIGSIWQGENGNVFLLLDPSINYAAFPRKEGREMLMVQLYKPRKEEKEVF